jgi:hypothetical protein
VKHPDAPGVFHRVLEVDSSARRAARPRLGACQQRAGWPRAAKDSAPGHRTGWSDTAACLEAHELSAFGARMWTEHSQPTLSDISSALDRGQRGNVFDVYSPEVSRSGLQRYRRRAVGQGMAAQRGHHRCVAPRTAEILTLPARAGQKAGYLAVSQSPA